MDLLLLIWLIAFAVDCGCIAKEKGRSAGLWAILGFFFTIIALLIIVCLPDKTNKRGY